MKTQVLWRLVGALLIALLAAALGIGICTVMTADKAERCLHACFLTTRALTAYVEQRHAWPTSWEDLAAFSPADQSLYGWPGDIDAIRGFVDLDFHIAFADLVAGRVSARSTIKPRGPVYESWDRYMFALESALENERKRQREPTGRF